MSQQKLFFIVISLLLVIGCQKEPKKVVSPIKIEFKKEAELELSRADSLIAKFDVEIADDDFERQTGLMNRHSMEDSQGMLFVFDDENFRSFYMKNTYIPLDLIYLDKDGKIVSFQLNAQPLGESSLPSNSPAKYVLEINAGLAEQFGLQVDDQMIFSLINK